MLSFDQKDALKNIVELIEDERFPAYRNITDYVVQLLPHKEQEEANNFIDELYAEHDIRKKKKRR